MKVFLKYLIVILLVMTLGNLAACKQDNDMEQSYGGYGNEANLEEPANEAGNGELINKQENLNGNETVKSPETEEGENTDEMWEDDAPLEERENYDEMEELHELEPPEQDDVNVAEREEAIEEDGEEVFEEEVEITSFPIEQFTERWNAISDEQFTELYISSFDRKEEDGNRSIYTFSFPNDFFINVYAIDSETMERMQFRGNASSENQRYTFLTGASQVIFMSSLDFDHYDVNQIFHQLGIGPNASIPSMDKTVHHKGVQFRLSHSGDDYFFEALFSQPQ